MSRRPRPAIQAADESPPAADAGDAVADHRDGAGVGLRREVRRQPRERGWEGIIAKDERGVYEPNTRSRSWRKVKVRKESEFVIGGFTPPEGGREHFGALLVGLYDGARLRYVGKVGTGYTRETLATLAAKLARLRTDRPPFDP